MALAFPSMSASCLLNPFPESALASFLTVLRDVPHSLAEPFICYELHRHGLSVEPRDVRNVLFKLRGAGMSQDVVSEFGPSIKNWQRKCPGKPTAYVREERERCTCCTNSLLVPDKRHESFDQQMPQDGMRYSPEAHHTKFRAFTLHAGLQLAVFQPSHCPSCGWHYIAGWKYKVDSNRVTECRWIGPFPDTFFVIPKLRSWLAVDVKLLTFANSQLLHQKASFQSMFRVWVDMHPEKEQQDLLRGATGTLERNNTQRLEDAWMTWSATTWAAGSDSDVQWDFNTLGNFDNTLLKYKTLLDDALFNSVVEHIPDCPRHGHLPAVITYGKAGASRRVCSSLNKFPKIPQSGGMVYTGCDAHMDSFPLYCSGCAPALAPV